MRIFFSFRALGSELFLLEPAFLLAAWWPKTNARVVASKNEKTEVEMKSSLQFFCLSLFLNIHTRARIKVHTYQEEEEEEVEEL